MQCVQNRVTKTVIKHAKYSNITLILTEATVASNTLLFNIRNCKIGLQSSYVRAVFNISLTLCNSKYNNTHVHPNWLFLKVPKYVPSVPSSLTQFGLRFTLDPPTLWNDLPNDVRHSFQCFILWYTQFLPFCCALEFTSVEIRCYKRHKLYID